MHNQRSNQTNYQGTTPIHDYGYYKGLSQVVKTGTENVIVIDVEEPDSEAELRTLQREFEQAMDEHMELLRENKMLKERSWEQELADEYKILSMESESMLADIDKMQKEVMACERIIRILLTEM